MFGYKVMHIGEQRFCCPGVIHTHSALSRQPVEDLKRLLDVQHVYFHREAIT